MRLLMKNNIIIYLSILGIGITIGQSLDWGYFELNKEISVIEALTFFATICIALYVTKILEKEVQETRVQKDLYISKLCEIDKLLSDVEALSENESPLYLKITNKIHICGVKHLSTIQLLKKEPIASKNLKKITSLEDEIRLSIRELRRISTTTDSENELSDNIIKYSNNRILEIQTKSDLLKGSLLKLKILINLL